MNNILFVSPNLSINTGGKILSDNIFKALNKSFNVIIYTMKGYSNSRVKKILHALLGYSHGACISDYYNLMNLILNSEIDAIIFNHSYYGNIEKRLKRKFPKIPMISYFHNIEYKFHFDIVKRTKRVGNWLTWRIIAKNEKLTVNYSDYLIGLNNRDNSMLKDIYGHNFDEIIPMFLPDTFKTGIGNSINYNLPMQFGLFVGSLFYANYYGVKWISKNVCPFINIPIIVIGKGFEKLKDEFKDVSNLIIIGEVANLNPYYVKADFVISPIFDGSGMKTKTAEAFMYGKWVIGTKETFEGYEVMNGQTGDICNTKEEFISAIQRNKKNRYNPNIRQLYEQKYSEKVNSNKLVTIINRFIKNESTFIASK